MALKPSGTFPFPRLPLLGPRPRHANPPPENHIIASSYRGNSSTKTPAIVICRLRRYRIEFVPSPPPPSLHARWKIRWKVMTIKTLWIITLIHFLIQYNFVIIIRFERLRNCVTWIIKFSSIPKFFQRRNYSQETSSNRGSLELRLGRPDRFYFTRVN